MILIYCFNPPGGFSASLSMWSGANSILSKMFQSAGRIFGFAKALAFGPPFMSCVQFQSAGRIFGFAKCLSASGNVSIMWLFQSAGRIFGFAKVGTFAKLDKLAVRFQSAGRIFGFAKAVVEHVVEPLLDVSIRRADFRLR